MAQNKGKRNSKLTGNNKPSNNNNTNKNTPHKKNTSNNSGNAIVPNTNDNHTDALTNASTKNDQKSKKETKSKTFSKLLSDGLFTTLFWISNEKHPLISYFRRIIYIVYPFILITIFAWIVVERKAYITTSENFYSFADDYTTSFTMCFLLLFFFFANGIFIYHFNRHTPRFLRAVSTSFSDKSEIILTRFRAGATCLSLVLSLSALVYIIFAKDNGGVRYWYSKLTRFEYLYYCALILSTFYTAFRILFSVIINSVCIFVITLGDAYKPNENCKELHVRVYHLYNYFAVSLGIGVCFLITSAMMLYSDFRAAAKFNIILLLYRDKWGCLFGMIVLAVIYLGTLVLSIASVWKLIKDKALLPEYTDKNASSIANKSPVWTFVLTALLPGIAALVQILMPLSEII